MTMATRKAAMRMITMREFRNTFQKIAEPVKVVRARGDIEVIGTWRPEARDKMEPEKD